MTPRTIALASLTAVISSLLVAGPAAAAPDYDCSDFRYQEDAQAVYDQFAPADPYRLDADGDGIACETLPRRGAPAPTPPPSTPAPTPVPVPKPATCTKDWNGDGRGDLLSVSSGGVLSLHPGTGRSSFGRTSQIGTGWTGMQQMSVAGDLDRNGTTDLIGRKNGTLYAFYGNGTGGFAPGNRALGTGWNAFATLVAPCDVTGDGVADLLAIKGDDATMWLYPGNGTGGFGKGRQVGRGWGGAPGLTGIGDFTGDGRNDLVSRTGDGTLRVYQGTGTGGFTSPITFGRGWSTFTGLVGVGDVDSDQRPDLLARDRNGTLLAYRGRGNGTFYPGNVTVGTGWGQLRIVGSTI